MAKLWVQGPRFENHCRWVCFDSEWSGMEWGDAALPASPAWHPPPRGGLAICSSFMPLLPLVSAALGAQTGPSTAGDARLSQCWVFFNEVGPHVSIWISKSVVVCFLGFDEEKGSSQALVSIPAWPVCSQSAYRNGAQCEPNQGGVWSGFLFLCVSGGCFFRPVDLWELVGYFSVLTLLPGRYGECFLCSLRAKIQAGNSSVFDRSLG